MVSQKKCPHCGEWSPWEQQADDRCIHCGNFLDPEALAAEEAAANAPPQKSPFDFTALPIHPDDAWYVRAGKHTVNGVQWFFIGILSFIFWLISIVTG